MGKISQVRTYLIDRVRDVSDDFREWPDGFNFNNIPNNIYDKSYHILYDTIRSTPGRDQYVTDSVPMLLRLFLSGYNKPQEVLDEAFDYAHDIRLKAIRPAEAMSGENIKNVALTRMRGQHVESNDNAVIVEMEFDMQLLFPIT